MKPVSKFQITQPSLLKQTTENCIHCLSIIIFLIMDSFHVLTNGKFKYFGIKFKPCRSCSVQRVFGHAAYMHYVGKDWLTKWKDGKHNECGWSYKSSEHWFIAFTSPNGENHPFRTVDRCTYHRKSLKIFFKCVVKVKQVNNFLQTDKTNRINLVCVCL